MRYIFRLLAALTTSPLLVGGLIVAPGLLAGQEPDDIDRAGDLRRQIEDRFTARVQEELGLTDDQSVKMRTTVTGYFHKRREMEATERMLRSALAGQLRPGVAANQDSVAKLIDAIMEVKLRYTQSFRDELKEMSVYLTPVQRAQFLVLRERLFDRIREAREDRPDGLRNRRPLRP
jgi:hypothetical protein